MNWSNWKITLVVTLGAIFSLSAQVHSAKILSVAFISSKSHKITYERLLEELGSRGHEVTILSPVKPKQEFKNVRQILTKEAELMQAEQDRHEYNFFEMKEKKEEMNPFLMIQALKSYCEMSYDLPHVQELLKEKFDLVMMSGIFNECALGYVHKFNTSLIIVSPVTAPSWVVGALGGFLPPSFVPNLMTRFTQHMNFYQRTANLLTELVISLVQRFYFNPAVEHIYRTKLNDSSLPSVNEILKNASIVLSNGHFSLGGPRPFLPDVIEVGGMHCRPAKPLPKDLEDFVQSSGKDGFILFSMGSALKGSTMPEEKRKQILAVFGKLKQKVLWKWETETMPDLPKNVKLSKWLPQQDLLGHPKIRAFITHGGFGGMTEAAYHGVPLVGIPMFADQEINMERAERTGFGILLEYTKVDEETLFNAVNTVLQSPKYMESAKNISKLFRDQPNNALDRAVFWTEYVLRHKGAVHLRSAGRELNFFQYHSLDVIGVLIGSIFAIIYITFAILRFIIRRICGKSKGLRVESKKKRN